MLPVVLTLLVVRRTKMVVALIAVDVIVPNKHF